MLIIEKTVIGEIDRLQARVVKLVAWFNGRGEFEAALRTQAAIVALDNIYGGDGSMEEPYESDGALEHIDALAAKVNEAQDAAVTLSLKLGTAEARIAALEAALRELRTCEEPGCKLCFACLLHIERHVTSQEPPTTNSGSVGSALEMKDE